MLGRGFGSLMKNVKTDEWVDTLEKKMVEGADAVKRVIDNPQAAADKLSQQTEALKRAFQEGYAETVNGIAKPEAADVHPTTTQTPEAKPTDKVATDERSSDVK